MLPSEVVVVALPPRGLNGLNTGLCGGVLVLLEGDEMEEEV